MAGALSITASILGVTVPALHGLRLFLGDLQKIKDAPEDITDLENDIRSVNMALTSLEGVSDRQWESLGRNVADQTTTTISIHTRACEMFRADLLRWTSHSQDGKPSWRDQAKVGFLKQGRVRSMSQQLQNCKITINSVVSIATLYSIRHTHITERIKKMISMRQIEITTGIRSTDEQLAEAEKRLGQLAAVNNIQEGFGPTEDKVGAMRQIKEEHEVLCASRKLLDELLMKAQEDSVAKAVTENQNRSTPVTFGDHNSGFQVGVSNGAISGITFGVK